MPETLVQYFMARLSSLGVPDANTIAIGANGYNGNGANSGRVRIFTWSGTAWVQQGAAMESCEITCSVIHPL